MDGVRIDEAARSHAAFATGYRTDIDGLRAVAVVAVILFHARFWPFSGGFVGVDVFFVISGFLITSIIKKEIDRRDFSIARFYERRIRRIFPALFFLLLALLPVALVVLLPVETLRFGQTMLATALFAANIYFWREAGYFAPDAERNPLLHTWSLAVEEQFYIFFPLFLLLLLRLARPRVTMLALVAVSLVSLAFAQWQLHIRPDAVFYLLPTRAWELTLGAVLAVAALRTPSPSAAAGAGAVGLALIGASILLYTPHMPFPGLTALPPCIGAALVLYAGQHRSGTIARALSFAPVSFVGKISYSLYLWHLPPLVLARIHLGRELTTGESVALLALATGIAVLSYKLVETPFRRLGSVDRRWRVIGAGVTVSVVFSLCGLALIGTRGAAARYPGTVVAADAAQEDQVYPASCVGPNAGADCRNRRFEVLVWGDSHAAHYFAGIETRAAALGMTAQLQWAGGCPPAQDALPVTVSVRRNELVAIAPSVQTDCAAINRDVLELARANPALKSVALAGAWDFWAEGVDIGTNERRYLRDARAPTAGGNDVEESRRVLREGLGRTVAELRNLGVEVLLLGQVPDNVKSPSECVARAYLAAADPADCGTPSVDARARSAGSLGLLREIAAATGAHVLDPTTTFCAGARCVVQHDGAALYRDSDHMSPDGSRFIGAAIASDFFGAVRASLSSN